MELLGATTSTASSGTLILSRIQTVFTEPGAIAFGFVVVLTVVVFGVVVDGAAGKRTSWFFLSIKKANPKA